MKWNEYPKTEPTKTKGYLVTVRNEEDREPSIEIAWFVCGEEDRFNNPYWEADNVIAWAELPEPYEKPVRIKAYPISSVPKDRDILLICKDRSSSLDVYKDHYDYRSVVIYKGGSSVESFRFSDEDQGFYDYWAELPEIDYQD